MQSCSTLRELYGAVAKLGGEQRRLSFSFPDGRGVWALLGRLEDPVDDHRVRVRLPVGKHRALPFPPNDGPWDWYPSATEETKRALCRRFTEVREFTSVGKSRVLEKEEVLERMLAS